MFLIDILQMLEKSVQDLSRELNGDVKQTTSN